MDYVFLNGGSLAEENASAEKSTQAQSAGTVDTSHESQTGTQQQSGFFGSPMFWVLYVVALIALFYFFVIRPNKKREKEKEAVIDSIKVGDWVLTTSGFYGKVVNVYTNEYMVEFGTNKSVTIPVAKTEIVGKGEPTLTNVPEPEPEAEEPKKKRGLFK